MKGGNVFCKHVVKVGPNVLPGIDVGVLTSSGELIAIGKALVARPYMLSLKRGVAVKVRQGVLNKRFETRQNILTSSRDEEQDDR